MSLEKKRTAILYNNTIKKYQFFEVNTLNFDKN